MNNSVGGNLTDAGAVAFGGHNNAAPAQFEEDDWVQLTEKGRKMVADGMAHSIVRLQRELDEANARIAVLEEEQKILAKGFLSPAKAAVTDGGLGNSGAERPEPSPQFDRVSDEDAALHEDAALQFAELCAWIDVCRATDALAARKLLEGAK